MRGTPPESPRGPQLRFPSSAGAFRFSLSHPDRDGAGFRTNVKTDAASRTPRSRIGNGEVSQSIQELALSQYGGRACSNTKATALAKLSRYFNCTAIRSAHWLSPCHGPRRGGPAWPPPRLRGRAATRHISRLSFQSRPECRQRSAGHSPTHLCDARKQDRLWISGHFPGVVPVRSPRQESTRLSWPVRAGVGSGKDKGRSAGTSPPAYRGCVPSRRPSLQSGSLFHTLPQDWRDHPYDILQTCTPGFP